MLSFNRRTAPLVIASALLTGCAGSPPMTADRAAPVGLAAAAHPPYNLSDHPDPAALHACGYDSEPRAESSPTAYPVLHEPLVIYYQRGIPVMDEPAAEGVVDVAFCLFIARPFAGMTITAHTDTVGNAEDNMALSLDVAAQVHDEMVARGIDPTLITVVGRGEDQPRVATGDDVRLQANRAIYFIFDL